jgi:hypothetical protein
VQGHPYRLERIPQDDDELWWLVQAVWGYRIAREQVCEGHVAPMTAFADAFFARHENAIWIASRGLGGKSTLLAILGLTYAVCYGNGVSIVGGSGQQTERIHDTMRLAWDHPNAPVELIRGDLTVTKTRLKNGGNITALAASETSVRGPHPSLMLVDELDAFPKLSLLHSAMGQPMTAKGRPAQSVFSSTWHLPDGPVSHMVERLRDPDDPFGEGDTCAYYEWCMEESSAPPTGWLSQDERERARRRVTKQVWQVEYELQRPDEHALLILPETIAMTFNPRLGQASPDVGEYVEFAAPAAGGVYAHGADWAKEVDLTCIVTLRVDVFPHQVVAFQTAQRQRWPLMIALLTERLARYGGVACHDGTGIGNVTHDFVQVDDPRQLHAVVLVGQKRKQIFDDYLLALEAGEVQWPDMPRVKRVHETATRRDLYGSGHPPDEFVAGALSFAASKEAGYDLGITI